MTRLRPLPDVQTEVWLMTVKVLLATVMALSLGGCSLAPTVEKPEPSVPENWSSARLSANEKLPWIGGVALAIRRLSPLLKRRLVPTATCNLLLPGSPKHGRALPGSRRNNIRFWR